MKCYRISNVFWFILKKAYLIRYLDLEYNKIKNIPKKTLDLLGNPNLRLMELIIICYSQM
jgi:hypothetical protein